MTRVGICIIMVSQDARYVFQSLSDRKLLLQIRNKNNTCKLARPLVVTVVAAVIAGTLGIMTSAEGCTIARYVGVKYSLPSVTAENDYGSRGNPYSFSDPPMVLFNGETITEYSDIYPGSTVENIKTGSSLTVCRKTADGGRMSAKYGRTSEKAICALLKSLYPILPRRSHNE